MAEQPTAEIAPNEQPATNSSDAVQAKREVFSGGFQFHEFSALLAVLMPIAFLVLGVVEALGLLWRPIAGVLYLLLLVGGLFILLNVLRILNSMKPLISYMSFSGTNIVIGM